MLKRLSLLSIACFLSILFLTSCSDDPASSANNEPPTLPPASSMEVEFSSLLGAQQPQKTTTQAIDYYIQAVYRAGSLEGIIEDNISRPKALLSAAEDTVAVLNDNQQWQWSYQTVVDSTEYQTRLVGERITANTVKWSLFVTDEEEELNNKLFFSGTATQDGESGSWTINSLSSSKNPEAVAELNWEFSAEAADQLTVDILSENGAPESHIEYTSEMDTKTVKYLRAGDTDTTTTHWNVDTRAGYLITPEVNRGNKACWDETLENVSCSE